LIDVDGMVYQKGRVMEKTQIGGQNIEWRLRIIV
jgi:hypothetical protein